jgi:excinuclease UvrABC nuclease subunit
MIEAAKNLEFERAAQLRDKINELRGAPVIKSGNAFGSVAADDAAEAQKIWQPRSPKRGGKRVAR